MAREHAPARRGRQCGARRLLVIGPGFIAAQWKQRIGRPGSNSLRKSRPASQQVAGAGSLALYGVFLLRMVASPFHVAGSLVHVIRCVLHVIGVALQINGHVLQVIGTTVRVCVTHGAGWATFCVSLAVHRCR